MLCPELENSMSRKPEVLIVGAGIDGLAPERTLLRWDVGVRIFDWLFEDDATPAPLALPMAEALSFDVVNTPEAITQLAS